APWLPESSAVHSMRCTLRPLARRPLLTWIVSTTAPPLTRPRSIVATLNGYLEDYVSTTMPGVDQRVSFRRAVAAAWHFESPVRPFTRLVLTLCRLQFSSPTL